jgi:hypothetical protein
MIIAHGAFPHKGLPVGLPAVDRRHEQAMRTQLINLGWRFKREALMSAMGHKRTSRSPSMPGLQPKADLRWYMYEGAHRSRRCS